MNTSLFLFSPRLGESDPTKRTAKNRKIQMPEGLPGGRGMLRLQIHKCRCITRSLHNTFDFQTRCKQEVMKNMLSFALAEVVDKLRMKKRILTRIFQCMTNENRTEKLWTRLRRKLCS